MSGDVCGRLQDRHNRMRQQRLNNPPRKPSVCRVAFSSANAGRWTSSNCPVVKQLTAATLKTRGPLCTNPSMNPNHNKVSQGHAGNKVSQGNSRVHSPGRQATSMQQTNRHSAVQNPSTRGLQRQTKSNPQKQHMLKTPQPHQNQHVVSAGGCPGLTDSATHRKSRLDTTALGQLACTLLQTEAPFLT